VIEHLRESAVVIVPLRIGGGTRLKIYEAMAAGKAVVSTTVGAEGLDVHDGRDIILADDARAFSQAVIMLLRDRELRGRYEKAAAQTAARYDWPAIGERFSEVLGAVASEKLDVKTLASADLPPHQVKSAHDGEPGVDSGARGVSMRSA
jgi:polysaccharide biosynthesis protein PslH